MWDFMLSNWKEIFGFVITFFGVILPFFQYIHQKRLEQKDKRFQSYHKLLDDLLGTNNPSLRLDRQVAIIFELFNFKDYHLVTLRILKGLKESWSHLKGPDYKRLIDEIDLTIKEIERYQALNLIRKNFFHRK